MYEVSLVLVRYVEMVKYTVTLKFIHTVDAATTAQTNAWDFITSSLSCEAQQINEKEDNADWN